MANPVTAASDATDKTMLALTTFNDKLYNVTRPEAQKMLSLMRKLRLAADAERDAASQQFKDVKTKLEKAVAREQTAKSENESAQDQLKMLREEVAHLEGEVKKLKCRERERESKMRDTPTTQSHARGLSHDQGPQERRKSSIAEPDRRESDACLSLQVPRERRSSTSTFPADGTADQEDPTTRPERFERRSKDSYRPIYSGSSNKRRRASDDNESDDTSTASLLAARKPVCGFCKQRGVEDSCDGHVICENCEKVGLRKCSYWLCNSGVLCRKEKCDYLHPDQWDFESERGERKVLRQDGTKVSGFGKENQPL